MMSILRVLALVGALSPLSVASASPLRDDLLVLLGGYEDLPTAEQLRALGAGVDAELMAIADDAGVPSSRRSRALSSLQFFPNDATRVFLEAHVDAGDKGILRRKAVLALGAGFGGAAVPKLAAALADSDATVRVAAAQALAMVGDAPAKDALNARLQTEVDANVRAAITAALGAE